jgi:hypothetical protein
VPTAEGFAPTLEEDADVVDGFDIIIIGVTFVGGTVSTRGPPGLRPITTDRDEEDWRAAASSLALLARSLVKASIQMYHCLLMVSGFNENRGTGGGYS